ncbi:MAG: hypothetical protein A2X49_12260 [Lentisphaerae bacterium GWF2_52_8]|nr:MAG: hypothetical protein A2X49_12260 [Lentisphaerae bacterium GWF2_52_8]
MKVLIIDDEQDVLENVAKILEFNDYSVLGAENGHDGIRMAREEKPNLILCDITMPGCDGYEVLNELRKDRATDDIPFIFLSAKADRPSVRRGMTLGADDYISKPFQDTELLDAIETQAAKKAAAEKKLKAHLDGLRGCLSTALPHELMTPLNAILGFSNFLQEKAGEISPVDLREISRLMKEGAGNLHKLLSKFMLFAKLEGMSHDPAAKRRLNSNCNTDARPYVADTAAIVAERFQRSADLQLHPIPQATLKIEEWLFAKAVEELIENAFKFSATGTPVEVRGTVASGLFTVSVTDCGCGLSSEQVARIGGYIQFDRPLREQQGIGLGLAIVKHIAEFHYGALVIESQPGCGATVRFSVPLNPQSSSGLQGRR